MPTDEELITYETTNRLLGLPTTADLKTAYLQYDFDRKKVAAHFGISTHKLNEIKRKLLGDARLPSHASYVRQWNEVKWYTGSFPEWTHIPPNPTGHGSYYKSP